MTRIMYRTIANEKVVLGRAEMPEATARKTGFGALAVFAKHVINSVRYTLEGTSIARELAALNDRELADQKDKQKQIQSETDRLVRRIETMIRVYEYNRLDTSSAMTPQPVFGAHRGQVRWNVRSLRTN